ncbi:hypothetical protein JCM8547_008912 [Rhodosporidiobolus lusitaniae]
MAPQRPSATRFRKSAVHSSRAAASHSEPQAAFYCGSWSPKEKDVLVQAVQKVGQDWVDQNGWTPVQQALVDMGFAMRTCDEISTQHRMLVQRSHCLLVPPRPISPGNSWTDDEDALILAVVALTQAKTPFVWSVYTSLFSDRGARELGQRYRDLRDGMGVTPPRKRAINAKVDEKKREISRKFPHLYSPTSSKNSLIGAVLQAPPAPRRRSFAPQPQGQTLTLPPLPSSPSFPRLSSFLQPSDPYFYSLSTAPLFSIDSNAPRIRLNPILPTILRRPLETAFSQAGPSAHAETGLRVLAAFKARLPEFSSSSFLPPPRFTIQPKFSLRSLRFDTQPGLSPPASSFPSSSSRLVKRTSISIATQDKENLSPKPPSTSRRSSPVKPKKKRTVEGEGKVGVESPRKAKRVGTERELRSWVGEE